MQLYFANNRSAHIAMRQVSFQITQHRNTTQTVFCRLLLQMIYIYIFSLQMISDAENVKIDDNAIDKLIEVCEGDLRKSITYLQSVASSYRDSSITINDIDSMTGVVPIETIDLFLGACRSLKYETVQDAVKVKCR